MKLSLQFLILAVFRSHKIAFKLFHSLFRLATERNKCFRKYCSWLLAKQCSVSKGNLAPTTSPAQTIKRYQVNNACEICRCILYDECMAGLLLWSVWRETFTSSSTSDFKAALHLNTSVCSGCGILDITLEFPGFETFTGITSFLSSHCDLPHYQFPFTVMQVETHKNVNDRRLRFSIKMTIVAVTPHSDSSETLKGT